MNSVILKKDGQLNINGVDIPCVWGFSIKSVDGEVAKITVQFDTTDFEVEVGVDDFQLGKPLFENGDNAGNDSKSGG